MRERIHSRVSRSDQGKPSNHEAANFARLGNYAFVYGFLLCVGNLGLLALLATTGFPLDGSFGGIEIERLLFKLFAVAAWAISAYAWLASRQDRESRYRRVMARFLVMGAIFVGLSVDYGDMTKRTVALLQKVDACCVSHANLALPGDPRQADQPGSLHPAIM